jgi:hypothetical protein
LKGAPEILAAGLMKIAAGSLLRHLENFKLADGSIILYQTCSALIALGNMPGGNLEAISKMQIAFKDKAGADSQSPT